MVTIMASPATEMIWQNPTCSKKLSSREGLGVPGHIRRFTKIDLGATLLL